MVSQDACQNFNLFCMFKFVIKVCDQAHAFILSKIKGNDCLLDCCLNHKMYRLTLNTNCEKAMLHC